MDIEVIREHIGQVILDNLPLLATEQELIIDWPQDWSTEDITAAHTYITENGIHNRHTLDEQGSQNIKQAVIQHTGFMANFIHKAKYNKLVKTIESRRQRYIQSGRDMAVRWLHSTGQYLKSGDEVILPMPDKNLNSGVDYYIAKWMEASLLFDWHYVLPIDSSGRIYKP
jgi:hypothetical protein